MRTRDKMGKSEKMNGLNRPTVGPVPPPKPLLRQLERKLLIRREEESIV